MIVGKVGEGVISLDGISRWAYVELARLAVSVLWPASLFTCGEIGEAPEAVILFARFMAVVSTVWFGYLMTRMFAAGKHKNKNTKSQ